MLLKHAYPTTFMDEIRARHGELPPDGSDLASAAAGTRTKWKTTAPFTQPSPQAGTFPLLRHTRGKRTSAPHRG